MLYLFTQFILIVEYLIFSCHHQLKNINRLGNLFIPTFHHFLGSFCRSFGARCNPFGPIEYSDQSPLHEILVKQTAPSHVTTIRDKGIIPRNTVYLTPCQVGKSLHISILFLRENLFTKTHFRREREKTIATNNRNTTTMEENFANSDSIHSHESSGSTDSIAHLLNIQPFATGEARSPKVIPDQRGRVCTSPQHDPT
jgi:hypothetical protein